MVVSCNVLAVVSTSDEVAESCTCKRGVVVVCGNKKESRTQYVAVSDVDFAVVSALKDKVEETRTCRR